MTFSIYLRQWWGMSHTFPYAVFDHVPESPYTGDSLLDCWHEARNRFARQFLELNPDLRERESIEALAEELGWNEHESQRLQGDAGSPASLFDLDDWDLAGRAAGWFKPQERVVVMEPDKLHPDGTGLPGIRRLRDGDQIPNSPSPFCTQPLAVVERPAVALAIAAALNVPNVALVLSSHSMQSGRIGARNVAAASHYDLEEMNWSIKQARLPKSARVMSAYNALEIADLSPLCSLVQDKVQTFSNLTDEQLLRRIPDALKSCWLQFAQPWLRDTLDSEAQLSASAGAVISAVEGPRAGGRGVTFSAPEVDLDPILLLRESSPAQRMNLFLAFGSHSTGCYGRQVTMADFITWLARELGSDKVKIQGLFRQVRRLAERAAESGDGPRRVRLTRQVGQSPSFEVLPSARLSVEEGRDLARRLRVDFPTNVEGE